MAQLGDRLEGGGSVGGRLVAALEQTWAAICARHPDLPPAVLIVGAGSGQKAGQLRLGSFGARRWQATADAEGSEAAPEVFVGGEGLARGAADVLATLLHEAAHALADVRQIADTSRRGQYHNKRFKALAEELGLDVGHDEQIGWSPTTLPAATAIVYGAQIAELQAAITAVRRHEMPAGPGTGAGSRTTPLARCGCPRRIRVAPSVLGAGAILCTVCEQPFTLPDRAGHSTGRGDR